MASPNDSAGRIHKRAFISKTSALVFFIICLLSVFARFYIRLRIQRQIGVDDAFLLFGTGCLIAAVGLLFNYVDKMYMVEAFIMGISNVTLGPNFINDAFWFQKVIAVALILTGSKADLVFRFAISQMIVDIVGDLLILYIPCRLIWQIKAKWVQKVALASSLCLTMLVIMCTIIRAAGIRSGKAVDFVWEVYWQYIAASLGLSMMAATAFRSLFVSHRNSLRQDQQASDTQHRRFSYANVKSAFSKFFSVGSWRLSSRPSKDITTTTGSSQDPDVELGKIERGTITGLRTFMGGFGWTKTTASQMMRTQPLNETSEYHDSWPLTNKNGSTGNIVVSRTIEQTSADGDGEIRAQTLSRPESVRDSALKQPEFIHGNGH
ncbi:MAG: hypothetical protein Q9160_006363 [Pyrenula sp. 1 TL-2023]